MKYSLIFSLEKNNCIDEMIKFFKEKFCVIPPEFELIFLIDEENENKFSEIADVESGLNIRAFCFDKETTEDMRIESAVDKIHGDSLILSRSSFLCKNLNIYNRIIELHSSGKHIVVSKQDKHDNVFFDYVRKFYGKTLKFLYGFDTYPGEADVILLDKQAVDILKATPGRSPLLTKFNNWCGYEIGSVKVPVSTTKSPKTKAKKSDVYSFCSFSVIFAALLSTQIALHFLHPVSTISNITFIAFEVGSLLLSGYFLFRILFKKKYGELSMVPSAIIKKEV